MASHVTSIIETGLSGTAIDIECHITNGLPAVIIVGSANRSLEEAKERLRGAFANSQLQLPRKRVTINLAPADIPKHGTGFDLAIAAAILVADPDYATPDSTKAVVIGELGLDGHTRPIRGIIGKLLAARKLGYHDFFIPQANLAQASLVPGVRLFPVKNLGQLHRHLAKAELIVAATKHKLPLVIQRPPEHDLSEVVGQAQAKRALEIAATGGHNLLLSGPPGTGKSMLAQCLPALLPPLSGEEILAVTHLHSLANLEFGKIVTTRPFREPHHSISLSALLGGGPIPRPGEISLAHQGVLFLDELPEFHRDAIEALRQPLEEKAIRIGRGQQNATFPANFVLIATANPCPCGYYGSDQPCTCPAHQVERYRRKLSGPILDRIDLQVEVGPTEHSKLLQSSSVNESSAQVATRVLQAKQRQTIRSGNSLPNALLSNRHIRRDAHLTSIAKKLLDQAGNNYQLSARAYLRTIKVARTIADLADSRTTDLPHITEALQYRQTTVV